MQNCSLTVKTVKLMSTLFFFFFLKNLSCFLPNTSTVSILVFYYVKAELTELLKILIKLSEGKLQGPWNSLGPSSVPCSGSYGT